MCNLAQLLANVPSDRPVWSTVVRIGAYRCGLHEAARLLFCLLLTGRMLCDPVSVSVAPARYYHSLMEANLSAPRTQIRDCTLHVKRVISGVRCAVTGEHVCHRDVRQHSRSALTWNLCRRVVSDSNRLTTQFTVTNDMYERAPSLFIYRLTSPPSVLRTR